jgi:hypothetical protein
MKSLFFAIACMLLAPAVRADDQMLFSRYSTQFALRSYDEKTSTAYFDGQITMTGELQFSFDAPGSGKSGELLWTTFVPDPKARILLPQVIGGKLPAPIKQLLLRSQDDVLSMAFGPARAAEFLHGSHATVTRRATVTLTDFWTSVECDHRSYGATILAIASEPFELVLDVPSNGGC